MLNYIKDQIKEDAYTSLTEAVADKVASGDDEVRDMFLDDPDAMVIGSEDDPEVAKVVDSLPDELPETSEVNDKDIEQLKEYFNLSDEDLEGFMESSEELEAEVADDGDVEDATTESKETVEESEMGDDDNYENDDASIYNTPYNDCDMEDFLSEDEAINEALEEFDGIEEIFESFDDCLLEGEQADAYRARKEKERQDKENAENERFVRKNINKANAYYRDGKGDMPKDVRDGAHKFDRDKGNAKFTHDMRTSDEGRKLSSINTQTSKDAKRTNTLDKATKMYNDPKAVANARKYSDAHDAHQRHERRHGKKEGFEEMDDMDIMAEEFDGIEEIFEAVDGLDYVDDEDIAKEAREMNEKDFTEDDIKE